MDFQLGLLDHLLALSIVNEEHKFGVSLLLSDVTRQVATDSAGPC